MGTNEINSEDSLVIPERYQIIYIKSVVKPVPIRLWPQTQMSIVWDYGYNGYKAEDPAVTLAMILLTSTEKRTVEGLCYPSMKFYMVSSMTGDTARRVGIVILEVRTKTTSQHLKRCRRSKCNGASIRTGTTALRKSAFHYFTISVRAKLDLVNFDLD